MKKSPVPSFGYSLLACVLSALQVAPLAGKPVVASDTTPTPAFVVSPTPVASSQVSEPLWPPTRDAQPQGADPSWQPPAPRRTKPVPAPRREIPAATLRGGINSDPAVDAAIASRLPSFSAAKVLSSYRLPGWPSIERELAAWRSDQSFPASLKALSSPGRIDMPAAAALRHSLGIYWFETGYFSRALQAHLDAWNSIREDQSPAVRELATEAGIHAARLLSRLGRQAELHSLLTALRGRPVEGAATELLQHAEEAAMSMKEMPGLAFKCGPFALLTLRSEWGLDKAAAEAIQAAESTPQGFSLAQVATLAGSAAPRLKLAFRPPGAPIIAPAVVHWRSDHFAALLPSQGKQHWVVKDPTFGRNFFVTQAALDDEASGYCLISGDLPAGWRTVSPEEAARVFGRGAPGGSGEEDSGCTCPSGCPCTCGEHGGGGSSNNGGGGGRGGNSDSTGGASGPSPSPQAYGPSAVNNFYANGWGMARYGVSPFHVALRIYDTPVGYYPPHGPAVAFTPRYNHRSTASFIGQGLSHLGSKWSLDWQAYLDTVSPPPPTGYYGDGEWLVHSQPSGSGFVDIRVQTSTGRVEVFAADKIAAGTPHFVSGARILGAGTPASPYERVAPDGTRQVFAKKISSGLGDRFLLTAIIDRQGHALTLTYDSSNRLAAITDAFGQVSLLLYGDASDIYRITGFSDPFGRTATLTYHAGTNRLASITDPEGITSSFYYENASAPDFITRLSTPYGDTHFAGKAASDYSGARVLEITDPLGRRKRYEYRNVTSPAVIPWSEPGAVTPSVPVDPADPGTLVEWGNRYLYYGNTFIWDEKTYREYPPNINTLAHYDKAHIIRWNWLPEGGYITAGVKHSEKAPFENRVWYYYNGQYADTYGVRRGPSDQPNIVARVLANGSTQATRLAYNNRDMLVSTTDPKGRVTHFDRVANGFDLHRLRQGRSTAPGASDLLSETTWHSTFRLPLTVTDAARQTTTFTYNNAGQPITATNALNQTVRYYYSSSPSAALTSPLPATPDPAVVGYLRRIVAPGSTAWIDYSYDGYGRVRTVSSHEGYALTYDYDDLDRVTLITYPDTTFEQFAYERLDLVATRDREGRWTRFQHDALGRVASVRDPLGRITSYDYCFCGAIKLLVDPAGRSTRWTYDIQGRLTAKIFPDGTQTTYHYDSASSRLLFVRDALGQEKHYSYDLDNRLLGVTYQNTLEATPSVQFTYETDYPRLDSMTDGTGLTDYAYHPIVAAPSPAQLGAGRLASIDGPLADDTLQYTYDALGRLGTRRLGPPSNLTTATYDALGRLDLLQNPLGNFDYHYVGSTGRLDHVDLPGGLRTDLSYRPLLEDFRLESLTHRGAAPASPQLSRHTYSQTVTGRITAWTQELAGQPQRVWDYGYDAADQLTRATLTSGTTSTSHYHYDRAGNRRGEQTGATVRTGTFNNLNQLVSWTGGGPVSISGQTDEPATVTVNGAAAALSAGNKFEHTLDLPVGGASVTVAATDAGNRTRTNTYSVTVSAGSLASYTYDRVGNQISRTDGSGVTTYAWDGQNRLVRIVYPGGARSEFVYDGFGRRVRITERNASGTVTDDRRFVWEGLALAERRAADGVTVVSRYFGQGVQTGSESRLYARDHLGSVNQLINPANGAITAAYAYDAFGRGTQVAGTESSNFRYTGHYYHATSGLHLAPYRAYDSEVGRWLGRDPVGPLGPDGANLYNYVRNSPTNFVDPDGRWAHIAIGAGLGALAGGIVGAATGDGFWRGALSGAIGGAVGAATFNYAAGLGASGLVAGMMGGGAGGFASGLVQETWDAAECDDTFSPQDLLNSTLGGVAAGGIAGSITGTAPLSGYETVADHIVSGLVGGNAEVYGSQLFPALPAYHGMLFGP